MIVTAFRSSAAASDAERDRPGEKFPRHTCVPSLSVSKPCFKAMRPAAFGRSIESDGASFEITAGLGVITAKLRVDGSRASGSLLRAPRCAGSTANKELPCCAMPGTARLLPSSVTRKAD
ncbi:MAG: hypothetical protein ABWZ88_09105 [Variovorax sp.]